MRVLVIGSGGREHALAWCLNRSREVDGVFVAPGNAGTDAVATNVAIEAVDTARLARWASDNRIDLTVVGPEVPLSLGIVDCFQEQGLRIFGPSREAARIETSKAFSKSLLRDEGIPTAEFEVFEDFDSASDYLGKQVFPLVVKASGLAAGKGVTVCATEREARQALRAIMVERVFGDAGNEVLIEECLTGQEVSVLAFSDGTTVVPMVSSQDHKPAFDGDQGPNTGGMGCYAPMALMSPELLGQIENDILRPTVEGLRRRGMPFVGVLYAGVILTSLGPQVLEFNCRFGDPETQVILPLLETDLPSILNACVEGRLDEVRLQWARGASVCVVMASGGYPAGYQTGYPISGLEEVAEWPDVQVFHAGTRSEGGKAVTAGGRVLGVTAWAGTLKEASDRVYGAVDRIGYEGAHFRRDIGHKALGQEETR